MGEKMYLVCIYLVMERVLAEVECHMQYQPEKWNWTVQFYPSPVVPM